MFPSLWTLNFAMFDFLEFSQESEKFWIHGFIALGWEGIEGVTALKLCRKTQSRKDLWDTLNLSVVFLRPCLWTAYFPHLNTLKKKMFSLVVLISTLLGV